MLCEGKTALGSVPSLSLGSSVVLGKQFLGAGYNSASRVCGEDYTANLGSVRICLSRTGEHLSQSCLCCSPNAELHNARYLAAPPSSQGMQGFVVLGPQVTFPPGVGKRENELHIPAGSEKKVGLVKSVPRFLFTLGHLSAL